MENLWKIVKNAFNIVNKYLDAITKKELDYIHSNEISFGIITPYRTGYIEDKGTPKEEKKPYDLQPKVENKERMKQLVQYLDQKSYSYERADGVFPIDYVNKLDDHYPYRMEKSLLVYNISFNELLSLAKYYNQDSFIFKPLNGVVGIYDTFDNRAKILKKYDISPNTKRPSVKEEENISNESIMHEYTTRFRDMELKYEFKPTVVSFGEALNYQEE